MADEYVEMERRKMEEKIFQQQQELEVLRRRLAEIEAELLCKSSEENLGSGFVTRVLEAYGEDDCAMEKSMDLDKSLDLDRTSNNSSCINAILGYPYVNKMMKDEEKDKKCDGFGPVFSSKSCLSTVFEEEEGDEDDKEVQKEVIEENKIPSKISSNELFNEGQSGKIGEFSREKRIQNIFTLCGNYRELSHNKKTCNEDLFGSDQFENKENLHEKINKITGFDENYDPLSEKSDDLEVYVKWEASKEYPGKLIATLRVVKEASLADLRKLIEIHFGADNREFTFLGLGDPSGAPVQREKEGTVKVNKLPVCNNRLHGHLACLRPVKGPNHTMLPLSSMENLLKSPKVAQNLSATTTPFVAVQRC